MPVDVGNLVELAFAGLFGGGITEAVRALSRRRQDRTVETVSINDQAMRHIKVLQKDADDSRAGESLAYEELRKARTDFRHEMDELAAELHKHRQFAELLTYRYRVLVSAIMSPTASLESLRELAQDANFGGN